MGSHETERCRCPRCVGTAMKAAIEGVLAGLGSDVRVTVAVTTPHSLGVDQSVLASNTDGREHLLGMLRVIQESEVRSDRPRHPKGADN